jgi:hypothetical protein
MIFSATCQTKWWGAIVVINLVIVFVRWITHSVPELVVDIDAIVLLTGALVLLATTVVRYRRALKQQRAPREAYGRPGQ